MPPVLSNHDAKWHSRGHDEDVFVQNSGITELPICAWTEYASTWAHTNTHVRTDHVSGNERIISTWAFGGNVVLKGKSEWKSNVYFMRI